MAERKNKTPARIRVSANLTREVLTEAGYRCAVPTCRNILAIDLHHIQMVSEGGKNTLTNLIALCPTYHGLFHRGTYSLESLYAWKGMLVALSQAFDTSTLDDLLFLSRPEIAMLVLTGDGVLRFTRLIASGLATFSLIPSLDNTFGYEVRLTSKGYVLVDAWRSGDREAVRSALGESNSDGENNE